MKNIVVQIGSLLSNCLIALIVVYFIYMWIRNRYLLSVSFRNVFRNIRRSLITIIAISIGAISIIIFGGYINDMFYGLRESTIRSQIGHLQLYKKGFNDFGVVDPQKYKLHNFSEIIEVLQEDKELSDKIETILPVVEFSGLVSTGDKTANFMGRGVDIEADRSLSSYDYIKDGQKLEIGDRGKACLGNLLAKSIGAGVDTSVMLLVSTSGLGLNAIDVDVKGTTESFSADYDKVLLKINIEDTFSLLGERSIDRLIILLKDSKDLDFVTKRINILNEKNNMDLEMKNWEELAIYYKQVKNMYSRTFDFVKWVICIMVIIFVSNTLFMAVMERVGETGTIRTIGTTKFLVIQNYIVESIIMGFIGGVLGIVMGIVLASIINLFGIPMAPPPGSSQGYLAMIRIDSSSIPFLWFSFKLSIITSFFASLLPAKKSIDYTIVDALRHY